MWILKCAWQQIRAAAAQGNHRLEQMLALVVVGEEVEVGEVAVLVVCVAPCRRVVAARCGQVCGELLVALETVERTLVEAVEADAGKEIANVLDGVGWGYAVVSTTMRSPAVSRRERSRESPSVYPVDAHVEHHNYSRNASE